MIKDILDYIDYLFTSGIPKGLHRLFGYMRAGYVGYWLLVLVPIAIIILSTILVIVTAKTNEVSKQNQNDDSHTNT